MRTVSNVALFLIIMIFSNLVHCQDYPITPVPITNVHLSGGFWATRMVANRTVTIPRAIALSETTGRLENFRVAGKMKEGKFQGLYFNDSDVYKLIEGASYSLASHPDTSLGRQIDEIIEAIASAQEPDGYLYTARTLCSADYAPPGGKERWSSMAWGHELYCAGHLYEAGVAHYQATGKRTLLNVALKNADLVCTTFGPGKNMSPCGHQEVEIASLVYYGLMEAAPGLRAFLGSRPELVAALVRQNAGVIAAFPRAVDVVDGRVPVPGGAPLEPFWESLVGAPVTDPSAFLLAVQTRAEGRMAFMLDTLWRLDEARRRFASSDGVASLEARTEDLTVLADAFMNTHREWRPAERPFWRVRMDPLVALAGIDVGADGRLTGPQAREFWMSVLDGQAPRTGSAHPGDVSEAVTAGWLVSSVVSGSDGASQLRLGAVAFTTAAPATAAGASPGGGRCRWSSLRRRAGVDAGARADGGHEPSELCEGSRGSAGADRECGWPER